MIIYEVICGNTWSEEDAVCVYLSNLRKASAFVAQNKKEFDSLEIKKHLVPNNKADIIKFLNRENKT